MPWIQILESDVQTRLAGAELTAFKTLALSAGQGNPLPDIITQVVQEVRGFVAACAANSLDADETRIPSKLLARAVDMVVYRLLTRLPVKVSDERKDLNRSAEALMRQVAACDFAVDATDNPAVDEVAPAISATVMTSRRPRASSSKLNGLV